MTFREILKKLSAINDGLENVQDLEVKLYTPDGMDMFDVKDVAVELVEGDERPWYGMPDEVPTGDVKKKIVVRFNR